MSNDVNTQPVGITELVLRDGHQSLFATRMRIDDMLPIAEKIDNCLLYTSPSPRDRQKSRMPSSA